MPGAHAAGLGRLTVQSALGQPLRAEIDVPDINPEEAASLQVRLAPGEAFRAAETDEQRAALETEVIALREQAMAAVRCPVLFLLGAQDQMTHPKAAQGLIKAAQAAGQKIKVVTLPVGHHQMTETPDATLFAIRDFLQKP